MKNSIFVNKTNARWRLLLLSDFSLRRQIFSVRVRLERSISTWAKFKFLMVCFILKEEVKDNVRLHNCVPKVVWSYSTDVFRFLVILSRSKLMPDVNRPWPVDVVLLSVIFRWVDWSISDSLITWDGSLLERACRQMEMIDGNLQTLLLLIVCCHSLLICSIK